MSQLIEVKVPDIGDFSAIPVIELCVAVGDTVKVDDALVTLESDKATMDVPSSAAGVVKEIRVKIGDRVAQGTVVVLVEAADAATAAPAQAAAAPAPAAQAAPAAKAPAAAPVWRIVAFRASNCARSAATRAVAASKSFPFAGMSRVRKRAFS